MDLKFVLSTIKIRKFFLQRFSILQVYGGSRTVFKLNSLLKKILFGAGLSILVIALVLTTYAAKSMRDKTIESTKDTLANENATIAAGVDADMEVAMDESRALALAFTSQIQDGNTLTRDQVTLMLKRILLQNPSFFGISTEWEPNAFDGQDSEYAGLPDAAEDGHFGPYWYWEGDTVALTPLPRLAEDDPAYSYYMIPKQTLQETVLDPYLYPLNGTDILITSLMVPVVKDGKFYATAGVDFKLDFLQQTVDQIVQKYPDGKLTIYTYTGDIAASTGQPDLIGKSASEIHDDWEHVISVIQSGEAIVEEDEGYISVITPIYFGSSPQPWAMNLRLPLSTVLKSANQNMWLMIAIGSGLFVLALFLLSLIAQAIVKPIRQITQTSEEIALGNLRNEITIHSIDEVGILADSFRKMQAYLRRIADAAHALSENDLTVEVTPISADDELGTAFEQMLTSLRGIVGDVTNGAGDLRDSAQQLAFTSNQAKEATSQIASTIQQIANGTSQQADSVNRAGNSVGQMASAITDVANGAQQQASSAGHAASITSQLSFAIKQVAGNVETVLKESGKAAEAARQGVQKVEHTLTGMQSIKESVGSSADKVREMGHRSEKIGDIVVAIEDIASQTNLLALNAAIEAARAGEAGKGFAVVADEVRKLAERSAQATKEIGDLVRSIQNTVAEAVVAMQKGTQEVEQGVSIANEAGTALSDIMNATDSVNEEAAQAAEAAQQMSTSAEELVAAVDMVSSVIEQNTAATEEMSASSGEVTEAIENIASVSEENSAAVEEVSASAEEMAAQVEEVSHAADVMDTLAEKMQAIVQRFRLEHEES